MTLRKIFRLDRGGALSDERGSAAVEFAIIAPILGLMLAGVADFGGVVFVKFRMESAVSAGANYAIVNASKVTATNASDLASKISAVVANSGSSSTGTNTVVVNNGPSATTDAGAVTTSGTASNADSCFCPTVVSSTLTWGSAAACGSTCGSGGTAGKFITITANRNYSPLFSSYGIVKSGSVSVKVTVQVQ